MSVISRNLHECLCNNDQATLLWRQKADVSQRQLCFTLKYSHPWLQSSKNDLYVRSENQCLEHYDGCSKPVAGIVHSTMTVCAWI